jgi:hypothetical protein
MKNKILISILVFYAVSNFGQIKNEFNLIQLDDTWGQEVIRFPARNINYIGLGDIRFPPEGWIKPKHTFFWSYTYAWSINLNKKITAEELAAALIKYFDSLNKVKLNDKTDKRKTTTIVVKMKRKRKTTFFTGKIDTYDRFETNERFVLNVKIESNYCKKKQKTVILFKFSPKDYKHKVWQVLDKIELRKGLCNY